MMYMVTQLYSWNSYAFNGSVKNMYDLPNRTHILLTISTEYSAWISQIKFVHSCKVPLVQKNLGASWCVLWAPKFRVSRVDCEASGWNWHRLWSHEDSPAFERSWKSAQKATDSLQSGPRLGLPGLVGNCLKSSQSFNHLLLSHFCFQCIFATWRKNQNNRFTLSHP